LKKRLAIFIHGGIGNGLASQGQPAIVRLVEQLATKYDVDVHSYFPPNAKYQPNGFSIFSARTSNKSRLFRWGYLVVNFFRQHGNRPYDCVYAFWGYPSGVIAFLSGKLIGKPCIIHLQGGDAVGLREHQYGVFNNSFRARLCTFVYSRCDQLIALTEFQKSFLVDRGINREIDVIPYGVSDKIFFFRPRSLDHAFIKFLHVGNLTPIKNQTLLLETFAKVNVKIPGHLVIVGQDYDNGILMEQARALGVEQKITFAGHQLHLDLPAYYHDADLLLHTSFYEGQAVVVAEACSCGTLVAGTPVGMLSDMGEHCGVIENTGESGALAEKIISVVTSPNEYQRRIHNAKAWVNIRNEEFTIKSIFDLLDKTIKLS
jgi:glycosyltransferase involved in cell wall biosynthesis